jgi:hypothetical protein
MIAENQQYISLNVWSVLAPAIMLAMLTICVNLIADAYVQTLGRSQLPGRRRRFLWSTSRGAALAGEQAVGDASDRRP